MQSIQTCMESQGTAINTNLVSINNAIMGCASSLSDAASVITAATDDVKDANMRSMKDLNKAIEKQTSSVTKSGDKLTKSIKKNISDLGKGVTTLSDELKSLKKLTEEMKDQISQTTASTVGLGGSMGGAIVEVGVQVMNLTSVTSSIRSALKLSNLELIKIANNTKKLEKKGIKTKSGDGIGFFKKLLASKEERQAKKVKIPEVNGGKNVGEIVNAMADAAVKMDKISLAKSILLKMKIRGVFDAFFETVNKHEKSMTPAKMKQYEVGVKSMNKISTEIIDLARNLAGVSLISLPAKIGAKTAKKLIKGTLDAVQPLTKAKNIAQTLIATKTLYKISDTLVKFTAKMALLTPIAPIALIGMLLTGFLIKEARWALKPLSTAKNLAKVLVATKTLDKISTSMLFFTAKMALLTVLAPVAMAGLLLTKLVIMEANWALKPLSKITATKKYVTAALNLELIGKSMLWFNAAMALNSILAVPALVGMGLTAIVLKGANMLFKNLGNKKNSMDIRSGVYNMLLISAAMITFTLTVLATTMITKYIITGGTDKIDWKNIVSFVGSVGVFALMFGTYKLFQKLGDKRSSDKVRRGAVATLLMSAAILSFSVALFVTHILTKQIVKNWKGGVDPWAIVGDVAAYGLMLGSYLLFKRIGKDDNVRKVMAAGAAILVMSLGLVAFSAALYITHQISKRVVKDWKGGVDWKAAVMDLAVFGLMLGSLWVYKKIGKDDNVKKAFAGFGAITAMSLGLVIFSAALWISNAIVGKMWKTSDGKMDWGSAIKTVSVFALLFGSLWIFKKAGSGDNMKQIMKGAAAVGVMSLALALFGLCLIPPLKVIDQVSKKALIAMPLLLGSLLFIVNKAGSGDNMKQIMKGSAAVSVMGIALGVFGFGIGFYTKSLADAKMETMIMMPVLLGLFVLEFTIAGKFWTDILKGTLVVSAMAVGLGVFGFGIKFYVDAIKDIGWKQVGMMAALIGIFGVEFALLGIPAVAAFVALGSAAVAAMGVGLLSFGFGVGKYATTIEKVSSWRQIGMMAALIGIFGLEFALLGPLSPAIIGAGVAFTVMGASLIPFGHGVGEYAMALEQTTWGQIGKMAALIGIFGLEFSLIGPMTPAIIMASAAFTTMGFALRPFGKGVGAFMKPIQNMKFADIAKMAGIIGIFGLEFTLLGPAVPFVLLGSLAVTTIAGAIKKLGQALQEWTKAKIDQKQLDLICVSIDRLKLAFMGQPKGESGGGGGIKGFFKKIGKAVSGAITGTFELAPIRTSASAIEIISGALSKLGRALQNWNDVNIDEAKLNILCMSIDRIKLAFQGPAKGRENDTKGFFRRLQNKFTGSMFEQFDLARMRVTAEAMTTAGITIKRLAKGMQEWSNSNIDVEKITELSTVLIAVRDIFSILGGNDKEKNAVEKGWFGRPIASYKPSDATRGAIEAKKMGTALKEIAKGLTEFYDTYGTKFSKPEYMEEFTKSIVETITSVSGAFKTIGDAWLGKEIQELETQSGKEYSRIFKFFVGSKNAIQEGIKSVKGIGDAITDIAKGMKSFKELVNAKDNTWITDVANGVATLLTGIQEPLIKFGTTDESFDLSIGQAKTHAQKIGQGMVAVHEASEQTLNYNKHKVDVTKALENVGNIGKMMEGMAAIVKALSDKKIADSIGTPGEIKDDWSIEGGDGMTKNMQVLTCGAISVFWKLGEKLKNGGVIYDIEASSKTTREASLLTASGKSTTELNVKKTPSKTYFGMAVEAANGIGGIISGIAEGFSAMAKVAKPDQILDVSAKVVNAIGAVLTAFGTIGISVTDKYIDQKAHELYPSMLGDSELTKKFGKIGNLRRILYFKDDKPAEWDKVTSNIKTIATGLATATKTLATEQGSFKFISSNPTIIFEPAANIMMMCTMFGEREQDTTYTFYNNGKEMKYTLKPVTTKSLNAATGIANKYQTLVTKMKNMSDTAANIKPANGKNFTNFTTQLISGMNSLAKASNNIDKSQRFVDSLRNAVKERVFENISSNTQKIANAINSINNDIMKPYAEMIAGFGKLVSEDKAKTAKALEDIKKTIEEIVETINKNGGGVTTGSSSTPSNGTQLSSVFNPMKYQGGGNVKTQQIPQQQQRTSQVTAELDSSALESAISTLSEAINKLYNKIPG